MKRLKAEREASLIIQPEQAKAAEVQALQAEWSNVWNLRDRFLDSALSGGQPVTIDTLEAAELLALETMKRRIHDAVALSQACGTNLSPATKYVAEVLGVELPKEAPQPPRGEANEPSKLVVAH